MMETLTANTTVLQAETKAFMAETRINFKNQNVVIHNLEVQVGNLSNQLANRTVSSMPSDTIKNPKEQVNVINLRSGRKIEPSKKPNSETKASKEAHKFRRNEDRIKQCPHCGNQTVGQPSHSDASP